MEVITLGAGCFWCVEAVFQQLPGVHSVTSGYMGGEVHNPTYEQVCSGKTGHAEVISVVFDPAIISLHQILEIFWQSHDPTTLNRQGGDVGTQYRSAIYFETPAQKEISEHCKEAAQAKFASPIVTEITKAEKFFPAEDYHQDYYRQNKNLNPYCQMVIRPKLGKLGLAQ